LLGRGIAKERTKILHDHVRFHGEISAATEHEYQQNHDERAIV
jgi:hypothetical protein